MKVIKIDIKQELLDTDKPYINFVKTEPLTAVCLDDGELPTETITAKRERYELIRVSEFGEERRYFIKLDDRKLFKDLFQISQDRYKQLLRKEEIKAEIYWLRIFVSWLQSNKLKRFIFKKAIDGFRKSFKEREFEFFNN